MRHLFAALALLAALATPPDWSLTADRATVARGEAVTFTVTLPPDRPPTTVTVARGAALILTAADASAGTFDGTSWTLTETAEMTATLALTYQVADTAARDADVLLSATHDGETRVVAVALEAPPPTPPTYPIWFPIA